MTKFVTTKLKKKTIFLNDDHKYFSPFSSRCNYLISNQSTRKYIIVKFSLLQQSWKREIQERMQKIPLFTNTNPEDLIRRRKDELRQAQDVREHYERKLERTNNLYLELNAILLQLELRERDVIK